MLSGTKTPVRTKKAGINVLRKTSAIFDAVERAPEVAQERQLLRDRRRCPGSGRTSPG